MSDPSIPYLTFYIGDEEYGVPLGRVVTALGFEGVTRLPMAPPFVRGLVSVKGSALPVLDLAERFGADGVVLGDHPSVLGVRVRLDAATSTVGLLATRLGRTLAVGADALQAPGAMASVVPVDYIAGLVESNGRFLMCLDVDRLLGAEDYADVAALSEVSATTEAVELRRQVPYLVVRLARERCAIALPRLREAVACGTVTRVPGAPEHVLGATNVRGAIVTVLDLARRYGIQASEKPSQGLLVLADSGGGTAAASAGFLADAIEGLIQVGPESINRTPPFGTHFPSELVEGMAPFEGQYVPILDCELALKPADTSSTGAPTA